MKREDWLAKGYTEEQVTEILDDWHKKNAEIAKENEKLKADLVTTQASLDDANGKIKGLSEKEAELNKLKQAQLSEEEKFALKQKEIDENLKQSRITLNTAKAKEIFSAVGGIDEDTLASVVTDDLEETIKRANNWVTKINDIKAETMTKTKEELSSLDTKPTPSNNLNAQDGMTWEKFDKLSSDEQLKFAEEHPTEFANL